MDWRPLDLELTTGGRQYFYRLLSVEGGQALVKTLGKSRERPLNKNSAFNPSQKI